MKNLVGLFILSCCFWLPKYSIAQTQAISDSLQQILDASLPTNFSNPGIVMTVYVPGQWTWSGASGNAIAGITAGQPISNATPTTRFRVGSITKNMVATCILKLEEDGLLSIEDPINDYLRATMITDTIQNSDTIRIRHLLNHTSGIANSGDNTTCQMDVLTNPLGSHTFEEAVYCGASLGELFTPGTSWSYSNTNYTILAMIIEEVSGMTYQNYLTQTIITPLGLTATEIPVSNQITGAHMGCYWNLGTWTDLTIIHPSTYTAWADVVSSSQDLVSYYEALRNGNIIGNTALQKMYTIDAAANAYGLGTDFYTISGDDYIGHYGEVANTSGLFFCDISSSTAPQGYYIAYNFNTQGAQMQTKIDVPVHHLLNSGFTSIEEKTNISSLHIFPNPSDVSIQFYVSDGSLVKTWTIIDLQGRIVLQQPEHWQQSTSIDVSSLAAGSYMLQLQTTSGMHQQKFIRQ
jgi:D-alanyl-D-alanine carboxypeptidase